MIMEDKRSIAELWREFRNTFRHIPLVMLNSHVRNDEAMDRAQSEQDALRKFLRATLLERCKSVSDDDGYYTRFEIKDGFIWSWLMKWDDTRTEQTRTDSPETANELISAYAFWAYELEQLAKESKGG